MKKIASFLFVLLFLPLLPVCQAETGESVHSGTWGKLAWSLDGSGLLTISGSGGMDKFTYQSSDAWQPYKEEVRKIEICDGVTSITAYAFYGYENLNAVILPSRLTSIGTSAFAFCTSLTDIAIPDNVTKIGSDAFCGCRNLRRVTLPNRLKMIEMGLFQNCGSLSDIVIPDSVNSIAMWAFNNCTSLTDITVPRLVRRLEPDAFSKCVNLKTVSLTEGITLISSYAFSECESLESIVIPGSVKALGNNAFYGCTSLEDVMVTPSNKQYSSIDGIVFSRSLKKLILYPMGRKDRSYIIPDGVTGIGSFAIYGCDALEELTVPVSVTRAEDYAVHGCTHLRAIRYSGTPEQQKKIKMGKECEGLTDVPWYYNAK